MIITVLFSNAQSSTIVPPATNYFHYHNFNTTNEGFSSPSIYSDGNDVSFSWDTVAGNEIKTSGLSVRNASLISPIYMQTTGGVSTIGFKYVAPIGAEYRIRIITAVAGAPLPVIFEGFVARKNTDGSLKLLWNVGLEIWILMERVNTLPSSEFMQRIKQMLKYKFIW